MAWYPSATVKLLVMRMTVLVPPSIRLRCFEARWKVAWYSQR